jgi:hypothetical protein
VGRVAGEREVPAVEEGVDSLAEGAGDGAQAEEGVVGGVRDDEGEDVGVGCVVEDWWHGGECMGDSDDARERQRDRAIARE